MLEQQSIYWQPGVIVATVVEGVEKQEFLFHDALPTQELAIAEAEHMARENSSTVIEIVIKRVLRDMAAS